MKRYYTKTDSTRVEGSFESVFQQLAFDLIAKIAREFDEQRANNDFNPIAATAEAKSAGGHVFKVALTFDPSTGE